MDLISDASQNITERLVWNTALKDQAGIARDMADGKEIEEIYGLGEAALFDEFFCFLSHFGITDLVLKLKPKIKKRETDVNFLTVFFIYLMRVIAGCPYFWHIKPVLLQSQPLMRLVAMPVKSGKEPAKGVYTPLQMETNKSPMMRFAALSVRSSSLLLSVPSLHQHWNASSTMLSAFWPHIPSFQNVLMLYGCF